MILPASIQDGRLPGLPHCLIFCLELTYVHGGISMEIYWKVIPITSTEVNPLPWKLPPTSMKFTYVHLVPWVQPWRQLHPVAPSTSSAEASTCLHLLAWMKLPPTSMEVGNRPVSWKQQTTFMYFHQLPWKLEVGQLPWRQPQLSVKFRVGVNLVQAAGAS